MKDNRNGRTFV